MSVFCYFCKVTLGEDKPGVDNAVRDTLLMNAHRNTRQHKNLHKEMENEKDLGAYLEWEMDQSKTQTNCNMCGLYFDSNKEWEEHLIYSYEHEENRKAWARQVGGYVGLPTESMGYKHKAV